MQTRLTRILWLSGLLAGAACGPSGDQTPVDAGTGDESSTSSGAGGAGGARVIDAGPTQGSGGLGGPSSSVTSGSGSGGGDGDATTSSSSSSSSSAGTTTGSGGAPGFQPCPTNGDPCKVLPLGDSITWGIQYDGAYRVELFRKAVAAGQKITFTGSLSNGPAMVSNVAFPTHNEGHSGWTIAQDTGLVPSPAFNTVPHIVLLMIGTNDIYAASGQATMPDRLGALVDKIIEAAPAALLVVAKITPLSNAGWNNTIKTYNDAIPGVVQSRVAAGKHVLLVDMNTDFKAAMLSGDGVHPNKSGYDFMGGVWYDAIKDLLPK